MLARHNVLFNQLEEYRSHTLGCVEGISEEEADLVPVGFNNNIRWNLGHVYLDQFLWIQHLTKEPIDIPDVYRETFGFGTKPAEWDDNVPSFAEIKNRLAEQIDFIKETYGDRLEEEFPATESGMHTIAQVLTRTIFHEGLHLGALISIKRAIREQSKI